MAALGGVLSALLLLALIALTVLVYKHYGHRLACGFGRALVRLGVGAGAARWGVPRGVAESEISRRQRGGGEGAGWRAGQREAAGSVGDGGRLVVSVGDRVQRRGEWGGDATKTREQGGGAERPAPQCRGAGWPSPAGRWLTAGSCPPPEVPAPRV